MALEALYGINTGLKLEKLHDYGELVAKKTGIRQPLSQSILGENAFSYELPTHLDVLLRGERERKTMPLSAAVVGAEMRLFWGINAMADPSLSIEAKLRQMQLAYTARDVERIVELLWERINRIKEYPYWLTEPEVEQICREVIGRRTP
jgi:2-isopropylmalate synthase